MKRILVTGAQGFVAKELIVNLLDKNYYVITQSRTSCTHDTENFVCDFTETNVIHCFKDIEFDAIIHLAAQANVAFCEANKEESLKVNVEASLMLAHLAKQREIPFVFTSTDLVYDGIKGNYTVLDQANPLMEYGKQKLLTEQEIVKGNATAKILRLSLVLGESGGYEKHLVEQLQQGNEQYLFTDEIRQAVQVEEVCQKLTEALHWQPGIYLVGGKRALNRYEIALEIAEKHSLDKSLLKPCLQEEVNLQIPRPKDLSFSNN